MDSERIETISEKMEKTSSDYIKSIEDGVQTTQVNNIIELIKIQ